MTFREAGVAAFEELFERTKDEIRNFPGCMHLELWKAQDTETVFFTFSIWQDTRALEHYRHSNLFRQTWAQTKPLFAENAQAWSLDLVNQPLQKSGLNFD